MSDTGVCLHTIRPLSGGGGSTIKMASAYSLLLPGLVFLRDIARERGKAWHRERERDIAWERAISPERERYRLVEGEILLGRDRDIARERDNAWAIERDIAWERERYRQRERERYCLVERDIALQRERHRLGETSPGRERDITW